MVEKQARSEFTAPNRKILNQTEQTAQWKWCSLLVNCHQHKCSFLHTRTYTHTRTLDLHAKFKPPGAKTVAAKEWGIFVDQPTNRLTE